MWKALCMLLVTAFQVVSGKWPLHVEVKNYTSQNSFVVLREFIGYTNSISSALPVEGYVYTVENPSAPSSPPFLPFSTWIAFVPVSVRHVSQLLVDTISGAGYSILLLDDSLSIDGDVMTGGGNISLVIIDNATDFFTSLPTSSMSIKVYLRIDFPITVCLCGGGFILPALALIIFCVSCGCCTFAYVHRRSSVRRHPTVGHTELGTLQVHAPNHQALALIAMEERASRKTAAELLDTLHLVAESEKTEFGVCSVCLASVGSAKECKALPCHHYFHPACIDEWLVEHHFTCPVCRQDPRITLADLFV